MQAYVSAHAAAVRVSRSNRVGQSRRDGAGPQGKTGERTFGCLAADRSSTACLTFHWSIRWRSRSFRCCLAVACRCFRSRPNSQSFDSRKYRVYGKTGTVALEYAVE